MSDFFTIYSLPVSLWLVLIVAVFLTFKLGFINIIKIPFAFKLLNTSSAKMAKVKRHGDISPLKALSTQIAGNLGISSIVGSALSLSFAGPGVILWLLFFGILLSIVKFSEITLGHLYKKTTKDGNVSGGSFYVIYSLLKERGYQKTGYFLGLCLAVMIALLSLLWLSFQVNQVLSVSFGGQYGISDNFEINKTMLFFAFSIVLLALFFLKGGAKRIGHLAALVVPFMVLLYLLICFYIIFYNHDKIISGIKLVYHEAFNWKAIASSHFTVLLVAMQRFIFSSESGLGTASIIHSSSKIKYSARQGYLAIFDGILISFILALGAFTVLLSGLDYHGANLDIYLMYNVFNSANIKFGIVLNVIIYLFAFTTILANGFYLQKSLGYFLSEKIINKIIPYMILSCAFFSMLNPMYLVGITDSLFNFIFIPNLLSILFGLQVIKEKLNFFMSNYEKPSLFI